MATLFSDDFNRANSNSPGAGWTERIGDWDILSNAMRKESGNNTASVVHIATLSTADYAVEVDIKSTGGVNQHRGPIARRVNNGAQNSDFYTAVLTTNGNDLDFFKREGTTWTKLDDQSQAYGTGSFTTVRIEVNGSSMKSFGNGVAKSNFTDTSFTAAGDAGLVVGNVQDQDFDNFLVEDFTVAGAALVRAVAQTVAQVEASAATLGKIKSLAETVQFSEDSQKALGRVQGAAETVQCAEVALRLSALRRQLGESVDAAEALLAGRVLARPLTETVYAAEGLLAPRALSRLLAEVAQAGEGLVAARGLAVAAAETLATDEAVKHRLINVDVGVVLDLAGRLVRRVDLAATQAARLQLAGGLQRIVDLKGEKP